MRQLESMARASTHGGYDCRMTSDPFLVSKAIFEWWWVEKDQRGEFYRRIKADQKAGAAEDDLKPEVPLDDLEMHGVIKVVEKKMESLDMDDVGLEDLISPQGPALLLDLVSYPHCTAK